MAATKMMVTTRDKKMINSRTTTKLGCFLLVDVLQIEISSSNTCLITQRRKEKKAAAHKAT